MRSFLCQTDEFAISEVPTVSIPPSHVLPDYMGQTFPALCRLWALTSDWIAIYYRADSSPMQTHVSVDFAEQMFQKLLAWSDSLHVMLTRGPQSTHHSAILQLGSLFKLEFV